MTQPTAYAPQSLHTFSLINPDPELILQRCRERIERDGWFGLSVLGDRPYSYTTGLTGMSHPELFITGLEHARAWPLLAAAAEAVKAGTRLTLAKEWVTRLGVRLRVAPVDVGECGFRFGVSDLYYGQQVPRLQLLP